MRRMDLEESQVEEHSYYLITAPAAWAFGLGLRIRPEEGEDGEDNYTV
jgi:hypothetical protein